MDRIFFENIRCFAQRQEVRLAPLTVLVGENSSGKSTFLALVRLAWDLAYEPGPLNFNEAPFSLGAFAQLVGKKGDSFKLGLELNTDSDSVLTISGKLEGGSGVPELSRVELSARKNKFTIDREDLEEYRLPVMLGPLVLFSGKSREIAMSLRDVWEESWSRRGPRPYAFAPVRSKPQRTYDPIGVRDNPEGAHVPMVMASLSRRGPKQKKALLGAIREFGLVSGLFEKVEVRHLGEGEGDPFQIQINIGGSPKNLIDVGYGVSQALPIVVDCLRGEERGTFLLQQPEVHLHPRAQAELGSFLGVLAKQQNKRFVIETHSDYLVDRIRMDIRDGKGLEPEDVSLLYFERQNGEANIHRLHLDEHGNILDPPAGYRSFFLEEERRFLGG